jgi:aryl-alcohol dehydrogenase-like predicted oxidoreductase
MEQEFDATLTGSDSPIEGIARRIFNTGYLDAYDFRSIDETTHLVIAQENDGHWVRIGGTDPYLAGWIDELADQANQSPKQNTRATSKKRELGNSGISFRPFAFGGNVFGWTLDQARSFQILDAFIDSGFDFIDTADVYPKWVPGNQGGESETIIGNWLKNRGRRDDVIIATKVGKPMAEDKKGLSARYIKEAVEASLRRLQTDYIDLYQSHDDDQTVPLQETMEAYAQLIKEGKVRAIGASNFTANRLREAIDTSNQYGIPTYQSLQPEYNLYDREHYETELEPLCREKGIGVISYYSLASGFLTGKYRSEEDLNKSQRGKGIKKYLNERGFRILTALDQVASEYNTTPAAVSMAWVIARPSITAPIASATSIEQLHELTSAADLNLSQEAIIRLNEASSY